MKNSEIIDQLKWRYACKLFDKNKKLKEKDIQTLVESLRLTASSFGLQPWKFLILTNQQIKEQLVQHSWGQRQVADCSHLVLFCHPKEIDESFVEDFIQTMAKTRNVTTDSLSAYKKVMTDFLSRKSPAQKASWMKNQAYIAMGNLLTTAAMIGVDSCPMEGIIPSKYDEVLGLKEKNLTCFMACPLGYRSSEDKYATSEKVRYPLDRVVEFIN